MYFEFQYDLLKNILLKDIDKIENVFERINYVKNLKDIGDYKNDSLKKIEIFDCKDIETRFSIKMDQLSRVAELPLITILKEKIIKDMHGENMEESPFI